MCSGLRTGDAPGRIDPAPLALLLHGTGASSHSWYPMLPWLRPHFDLLLIDLPGHAYTGMPSAWQASLPGMAQAVKALLDALAVPSRRSSSATRPARRWVHACASTVTLAPQCPGQHQRRLHAAGRTGWRAVPAGGQADGRRCRSRRASSRDRRGDPRAIQRLVSDTGSVLDPACTALYAQLVSNPGHVGGRAGDDGQLGCAPAAA